MKIMKVFEKSYFINPNFSFIENKNFQKKIDIFFLESVGRSVTPVSQFQWKLLANRSATKERITSDAQNLSSRSVVQLFKIIFFFENVNCRKFLVLFTMMLFTEMTHINDITENLKFKLKTSSNPFPTAWGLN